MPFYFFSTISARIKPKFYPYILIFISATTLIVSWITIPGSFNEYDNSDYTTYYLPVAKSILNGEGFTIHSQIAFDYPPGYPLLLSGFLFLAKITGQPDALILRLMQIVIMMIGALLIYALANIIWSPRLSLLVSILWSFFPLVLWAGRNPNTELPFSIFFYTALLFFLKGWTGQKKLPFFFFFCGILCGFSMLIRTIAICIGILLTVFILVGRKFQFRKKILLASLILMGNLIAVLPWELWIYSKTHQIIALCNGRAPLSILDGLTFAVLNPEGRRKNIPMPRDVKNLMNEIIHECSDHPLTMTSRELFSVIAGHLKKQPVAVIKLYLFKTIRSWYGTNSNRFETPLKILQFIYFLLLVWSVVALWKNQKEHRYLLIGGLIIFGYFWGMTIIVLSIVRYLMPVFGALIIFFPAILLKRNERMQKNHSPS
jgi:4-amino-4-deoxy-L-arabinose transferase-like glycosyltransferase